MLINAVTGEAYMIAGVAGVYLKAGRGVGVTDPLETQRMAAAALPVEVQKLRIPRLNDGARTTLSALVTACDISTVERTKYVSALTSLRRMTLLGIETRKP